jgi:hypothetical protein
MKHDAEISFRELLRLILPTLVCMVAALAFLKIAHAAYILPLPSPALFPDNEVLFHQSRASRTRDPASIILLGDSTCLMGVDARDLSSQLPGQPHVRSLALVVWLDLRVYAEVLSDFARANPGQVQTVVLLVCPAKLAGAPTGSGLWNQIHHSTRPGEIEQPGTLQSLLGLQLLRENVFSHLLETPLETKNVAFLGFSSQLETYQTQHYGSMIEQGTFFVPVHGRTNQWRLTPDFAAETRDFRSKMPAGCKLFIGLTPSPKSSSTPFDRANRDEVLRQWNQWMHADGLLTNLPPVLPDLYFSASAHLNELGQKKYTQCVARALAAALQDAPAKEPAQREAVLSP